MVGWENPDVGLLYRVNGLAKSTPGWVDSTLGFMSEYGVLFGLMVLGVWAWWLARRRTDAVGAAAGLLWAPLAASVAYLVNYPVRELVARPRPIADNRGLEVLVPDKTGYSFVSDHSTLTMAIAVGIFMVNRRFGLVAIALALFQGFGRVYAGVHYPTDVIGGFALGTALVLLLAPAALALLTPLTRAIAVSPRVGWLVQARSDSESGGSEPSGPGPSGPISRASRERDLAA